MAGNLSDSAENLAVQGEEDVNWMIKNEKQIVLGIVGLWDFCRG